MKKLILLGMAVAGVAAFAMPAAASALEMRDAGGKVALGSQIKGVSHNTKVTNTALGTLFCETVEAVGEVSVNGPSTITGGGGFGGAVETSGCEASGEPLTVTEPSVEHLVTTGGDTATATLSFVADVGPFECPYGGEVPGTYSTGSGNDTLTLSGSVTSPFEFCEGEGVATFEGTYTMTEAFGGQPVYVQ